MKRVPALALLAAAALILGGCGDSNDPAEPDQHPTTHESPGEDGTDPTQDDEAPTGGDGADAHDDERVGAAAADLADRTGADPDQVRVVQFQAVTWPDGSVGCPEEGMSYTQALVDGYRLILAADGEQYHYHSAGEEELLFCENPQEPVDDRQ
ncbi:MAG TPA: hypothetical protein VK063_03625 [Beutenbergiaceae bacterium]|nr:hypothetical protein [Beutenbergiaceae bacterium]